MTDSFVERAKENLSKLREDLPALRAALPALECNWPGTPPKWNQRELSDDARARADALARIERDTKAENLTRGITAFGDGRAPLRIHILDALDAIAAGITELEAAICDRLGLTPLSAETIGHRITRIIGLLDRVAADQDLADHMYNELARLTRVASRALGDVEPVNPIDARCPICDALSLRAFPEREVVVCVNAGCRCGSEGCSCQATPSRRHRWYWGEWPWLAEVLSDELRDS